MPAVKLSQKPSPKQAEEIVSVPFRFAPTDASRSSKGNFVDFGASVSIYEAYILRLREGSYLRGYSSIVGLLPTEDLQSAKLFRDFPDFARLFGAEILTVHVDRFGRSVRRTLLRREVRPLEGCICASHGAANAPTGGKDAKEQPKEKEGRQDETVSYREASGAEQPRGCAEHAVKNKVCETKEHTGEDRSAVTNGDGPRSFFIGAPALGRTAQMEQGRKLVHLFIETYLSSEEHKISLVGIQKGFSYAGREVKDQLLFHAAPHQSVMALPVSILLEPRGTVLEAVEDKIQHCVEAFKTNVKL